MTTIGRNAYHAAMSDSPPPDEAMLTSVKAQAQDLLGDTIALRRTLHEWPELGNELPLTRDRVLESLDTTSSDDDMGTGSAEALGDRSTDPGAATGDESGASRQEFRSERSGHTSSNDASPR